MRFLVMVSLLSVSCRADRAPKPILKTNQTSADLILAPEAKIHTKLKDSSSGSHRVEIIAVNDITTKFKYTFIKGSGQCTGNYNASGRFSEKRATIILNDTGPIGKRKLCVKGMTEDELKVQREADQETWEKIDPISASDPPKLSSAPTGERKYNLYITDDESETTKNVTGTRIVNAETYDYYEVKNCDRVGKDSACTCRPYKEITEEKIEIFTKTRRGIDKDQQIPLVCNQEKLGYHQGVCIYGIKIDGSTQEMAETVKWTCEEATGITITNKPNTCDSRSLIDIDVNGESPISKYKYKIYDEHHDCPASDSPDYSRSRSLDQNIVATVDKGEKTLCVIGQGDNGYLQPTATQYQWTRQEPPSLNEGRSYLIADQQSSPKIVAGTKTTYIQPIEITNDSDDNNFEWQLLVTNEIGRPENIIQVKETDEFDDSNDGWHDLRGSPCNNQIILKGQLDAGKSKSLLFRIKDYQKTNYGKPYYRSQEVTIRRKGYKESIRLVIHFYIPKLKMNFRTVDTLTNNEGIPRITLGPKRKRQTISIVNDSGDNIPHTSGSSTYGFNWIKYPVFFKPKWFFVLQEKEKLKLGLAKDTSIWPQTSKTTRIVVYSNGDSKNQSLKKRNTEHTWIHEKADGTRDPKLELMPYDSAYNYIEIVFDPDL